MAKQRSHITIDLKRRLWVETGNRCSIPNCSVEANLEIHHIDENPSNNALENLLLVCGSHHNQITYGVLDREFCVKVKALLSPARLLRSTQERNLPTRRAFIDELISQISSNPNSYRAQLVGPLFLHPHWWKERRNRHSATPDFDSHQDLFLTRLARQRSHNVRIILALSKRYQDKAGKYLYTSEDRERFKQDLLHRVAALWGTDAETGPDLICLDTGIYEIDYIFDEAVLTQTRPVADKPTSGGWAYYDPDLVDRARHRFDEVFDANWSGQQEELSTLRAYIESL